MAWVLMALSLSVVLAGQWVHHERHMLAVSYPGVKPLLVSACAWFGCMVQPVRQLDALMIDSVSFRQLGDGVYQLSFLVKNASENALAMPAVELVLTDADDQPAYRRVFTGAELGFKASELPGAADWPATVTLKVEALPNVPHVFGYRMLVFYP
jgi:hypothetical protein